MYRLERLNEEEYIWNYTELELDINLSNEIKGRYVDYRIQQDNLIGSVEGNYVLNQMLVLFIFGWQDAKQEGPKEMITLPNFHQVPTNLGWVVNIGDVEKRPLPVVIKREMLNFPKQLLRDPGVKHLCANLQHNIYWANFKNEME